jgi:hypothetical protein
MAMACFVVSLLCPPLSEDNFCHRLSASQVTRPKSETDTIGIDPKFLEHNRWMKNESDTETKPLDELGFNSWQLPGISFFSETSRLAL